MKEKSNDINKRWNDLTKERSYKYGNSKDIDKRWNELVKERSYKYYKDLMKERTNEAVNINGKETSSVSNAVDLGTINTSRKRKLGMLQCLMKV
jgi:hypothetical protein